MKRIAELTGGQFFAFAAGAEIPTNIWESIQATQRQRVMTYRSSNPNPQRLTISADSAVGSRLRTEVTFPAVRFLPVQVRAIKPDSTAVTRSGPQWDTQVTALTPNTLAGQIEISWPDGRSRAITSLDNPSMAGRWKGWRPRLTAVHSMWCCPLPIWAIQQAPTPCACGPWTNWGCSASPPPLISM